MPNDPALLWLRNDLRFDDNPAMRAAQASGRPVVCLYVLDDDAPGELALGSAQRWWLHHSLAAFQSDLTTRGGALVLRRGQAKDIVPEVAHSIGAAEVFWTRRYMEWQVDVDKALKQALDEAGHKVTTCNGSLLFEPWEIKTKSGDPYRVFTPFWRNLKTHDVRESLPRTDKLEAPSDLPASDSLDDWNLRPEDPNWAEGFEPVWTPGEKGARTRMRDFLDSHGAKEYDNLRNRPDKDSTSRMSPHLHLGEISPVTVWYAMKDAIAAGTVPGSHGDSFLSEIAWREFSYVLLYFNPAMTDEPLMGKFKEFEWNTDKQALKAWQRGTTGYPIVDAGMRQLWREGWMHNRVRMIVGSFLVKDLLIHWREGMMWFWDCLVDADPASNTAGWQWIAGCGADAAPFFRVFNPTSQGEKFDPEGDYVRKYVPELQDMPKKHIHEPAAAPREILKSAGVQLGDSYPRPIVNHKERREEALQRYDAVK